MREKKELLREKNIRVAVVTFAAGYFARQYVEETGVDWPLLIDEQRVLYHAYGMLEASFWDVWGPKTWWVYLKEIVAGHFPQKSEGDTSQRGGDVLIDPAGTVRFHHVGSGPADRPPIDAILAFVPPASSDIFPAGP